MDAGYPAAHSSKHHFPGLDLMGASSSSTAAWGSSSSSQKRKRCQVLPHDVIKTGGDADPVLVVTVTGNTSDPKTKTMDPVTDVKKQLKVTFPDGIVGSSSHFVLLNEASTSTFESYQPELQDFNYSDQDEETIYFQDDEEYDYDEDLIENDCDFNLSAKFDDLDIPPGVEATVPWLLKIPPEKTNVFKSSAQIDNEIDENFKSFKQFDTVEDFSDHHYAGSTLQKPTKDWTKRIQHEWQLLEKDLPESIFVRVYESRMDLLRSVIIGPAGTPYHDGLFFFDVQFPSTYPMQPPYVHYHSYGLRLNPNLYSCGKVCLSLLGTWSGSGCEKWNLSKSTMLQVLVSIQALVLNEKPYFNEPGYERSMNTFSGENKSLTYNENTFLLSCRTMLYSLRNPPKNFADFVAGHFRNQGHAILAACKAYISGAQVGSAIEKWEGGAEGSEPSDDKTYFTSSLAKLFEDLLMEFTVKGADCGKFLEQKVKAGAAAAAASKS